MTNALLHLFDDDDRLVEQYGLERVRVAEEIVEKAGTSDAHWSVLMAAADLIVMARMPWWRKDKYGWPIETIKGRSPWLRIVLQNIRKVTG